MSDDDEQIEVIRKSYFARTRDGQVIFFPFGPWSGYLLSDESQESEITSVISTSWRISAFVSVAAFIFGVAVKLTGVMTAIGGLLSLALYYHRIRPLMAEMIKLPRSTSARLSAMSLDSRSPYGGLKLGLLILVTNFGIFLLGGAQPDSHFFLRPSRLVRVPPLRRSGGRPTR